ncbi:g1969 [Coccomyxa viridis]|uniref:G1969 protein n=1 Tax=Coccomyxa viridis TaxID=1274662 RepID=A0ABP1FJ92_9CHLO
MALAILTACFEDNAEALLLGCAAALEPEANCPLDTRIQCLKTMESVSLRVHRGSEDADSEDSSDGEAADHSALTWPAQAADLLLYTLTNDPSIRARRAAMKTLKAAQGHLGCTGRLIKVLLLKCRDRDKRVQLSAYELLASMDSGELNGNAEKEEDHIIELREPTLALLGAYLKGASLSIGSKPATSD